MAVCALLPFFCDGFLKGGFFFGCVGFFSFGFLLSLQAAISGFFFLLFFLVGATSAFLFFPGLFAGYLFHRFSFAAPAHIACCFLMYLLL